MQAHGFFFRLDAAHVPECEFGPLDDPEMKYNPNSQRHYAHIIN